MKGIFISFEGIEGTGKTTQARLLSEYLERSGFTTALTEEPGGTPISRMIREVLLKVDHKEMHPVTELLLYNASRCQHLKEVILPALNKGKVVITDRFSDSTAAYQGYGRGIDMKFLETLDKIATGGIKPHLTLLLDFDVGEGLQRNRGVSKIDRFELEETDFHEKVRAGFLDLARREPERIKVIDASVTIEEIHAKIIDTVTRFLSDFKT